MQMKGLNFSHKATCLVRVKVAILLRFAAIGGAIQEGCILFLLLWFCFFLNAIEILLAGYMLGAELGWSSLVNNSCKIEQVEVSRHQWNSRLPISTVL